MQWRADSGKQRRETIGAPPKMKLLTARKVARARIGDVAMGKDPGEAKAAAKAKAKAESNALTFGAVADRYLAVKRSELRLSTYRAATRHLEVAWKSLRDKPIDGVARADVAMALQTIIAGNGRIAAARARATLSAALSWAMREGLCEKNVAEATHRIEENEPRDRVLDDREIKLVWNALDDDNFGRCIRLLILLGCRRSEIGNLRWSEIDLDTGTLVIPGDRIKNGKDLKLGLPPAAIGILKTTPRISEDYVFGDHGYNGWSYAKIALDAKIAAANNGQPLQRWTIHDLRRSARSGLGRVGVRPDIAERVVGHVVGSRMSRIYDHYNYEGEVRAALAKWADRVMAVVEGRELPSNVVPLAAASA